MLVVLRVSVSIVVMEGPFTTAFATIIIIAVEVTRETSRLRELVLRRRVEVNVGGWIREVWADPWGTVVASRFSTRRVVEEPGDAVGLLHGVCGVCGGRGGRAS